MLLQSLVSEPVTTQSHLCLIFNHSGVLVGHFSALKALVTSMFRDRFRRIAVQEGKLLPEVLTLESRSQDKFGGYMQIPTLAVFGFHIAFHEILDIL